MRIDEWRAIRPDLVRISILDRNLKGDVKVLVQYVLTMIDSEASNLIHASKGESFDASLVFTAKREAEKLIDQLVDKIASR